MGLLDLRSYQHDWRARSAVWHAVVFVGVHEATHQASIDVTIRDPMPTRGLAADGMPHMPNP
jgi:hypothetical protein